MSGLVDRSLCSPHTRCPKCGRAGCVEVRQVVDAKPPGTFSLAGVQMKFSARVEWVFRCTRCNATGPAEPKESPEEQARILRGEQPGGKP